MRSPGRKNGKAVPVAVPLELTYSLRSLSARSPLAVRSFRQVSGAVRTLPRIPA